LSHRKVPGVKHVAIICHRMSGVVVVGVPFPCGSPVTWTWRSPRAEILNSVGALPLRRYRLFPWYLDEAAQAESSPARGIRVLGPGDTENPYQEPSVVWPSGRVTTTDSATHSITVRRTPILPETGTG
jgi:hypothetical protein